jgi:hypothetical protein
LTSAVHVLPPPRAKCPREFHAITKTWGNVYDNKYFEVDRSHTDTHTTTPPRPPHTTTKKTIARLWLALMPGLDLYHFVTVQRRTITKCYVIDM